MKKRLAQFDPAILTGRLSNLQLWKPLIIRAIFFDSDDLEEGEDPYEKREMLRRKAAILSSDDEKFRMFMKLMRIALMLDRAQITHKKIIG